MTYEELIARMTIEPGDFVTLTAEEAAQVREIMQRRIPITVDYPVVCCECGGRRMDER